MIFNNLQVYYWARRLSHQINLFRGGYVVRHQSEDYNLSVALRQSALQKLVHVFWVPAVGRHRFRTDIFRPRSGAVCFYPEKHGPRYPLAGWIAAGVVAGGGLLENRAWAWRLEAPRLLASLARLLGLVWGSAWLPMAVAGGNLLVLGALGWLALQTTRGGLHGRGGGGGHGVAGQLGFVEVAV